MERRQRGHASCMIAHCPQVVHVVGGDHTGRRTPSSPSPRAARPSPGRGAPGSAAAGVGAPPRGRRDDAARHVPHRPDRLRARARPGVHFRYHRLTLRRLVGRGPELADVQRVPSRRVRNAATVRRRQRGALAGDRAPTACSRSSSTTLARVPGGARRCSSTSTRATRRTAACRSRGPQLSGSSAGSDPGDDPHDCIILSYCIVRGMITAAILGCAGYAGQETLDRVLAHPGLEPVALGSDSLAGAAGRARPSARRRPPRVHDERRGRRGRRRRALPLPRRRRGGRVRSAARRGRGRLSGAHRLADPDLARAWYGPPRGVELWPAGALSAVRDPDREPRLLRDGRAARARRRSPARSTTSSSTRSPACPARARR